MGSVTLSTICLLMVFFVFATMHWLKFDLLLQPNKVTVVLCNAGLGIACNTLVNIECENGSNHYRVGAGLYHVTGMGIGRRHTIAQDAAGGVAVARQGVAMGVQKRC